MRTLVPALPRPKSYSGFRVCLSRLLAPLAQEDLRIRKLCLLLSDTGYEAGGFLQEVFNAWDTFRIEGMGRDAWVLAWDVFHDAIVNLLNSDEELSSALMALRPV